MTEPADNIGQLTQEVRRLEQRLGLFEDALENMHHGVCVFDAAGRLAACNARFAEALGLPPDDVRPGMGVEELSALEPAGHKRTAAPFMAEVERFLALDPAAVSDTGRPLLLDCAGRVQAVHLRRTGRGDLVATFVDITGPVHTEATLRAFLDAIPDCVTIFDESDRLIHINPSGLEMMEAPDAEALSRPGYAAIPPEYRARWREVHAQVMAGATVTWAYEIVGLRGRRRHVEAHAVPFRLPGGAKAHMCISRDVSERKDAEDALRLNERRLRLVHEATGLAEFEADAGGTVHCSERMTQQLGLGEGRRTLAFQEWLDIIHPADRDRVRDEILSAVEGARTLQSEFRIIRPEDGEIRWISSHSYLQRGPGGGATRSIGAHLDITERKRAEEALRESEERFRLAVEGTGIGVWDYDPATGRREWSPRLLKIFGLPADAEPSLELAAQCLHPDDREKFLGVLHNIRDAEVADRFQGSWRIIRQDDGAERWIMLNCWSIRRPGRRGRVMLTISDVTDEKQAEERIR